MGKIGGWVNDNIQVVMAPNALSKGTTDVVNRNTGNVKTYPAGVYQNWLMSNFAAGHGYVYNGGNGYNQYTAASESFTQGTYPVAITGLTTNLTIEMKLYLPFVAATFLFGLSDGTPQVYLVIDAAGKLAFRVRPSTVFETSTNNGAVAVAGDYTIHARITNGLMSIFVNGVEAGGVGYAAQATVTETLTFTDKLKIGTRSGANSFDGREYWTAIYNDSISLSRIQTNHALGNDMGLIGNSVGDVVTLTAPSTTGVVRQSKTSISVGIGIM